MHSNLKLVITRPQKQGLHLQQALQQVDIAAICQPLLDYQTATSPQAIRQQTQHFQPDIIIFISVAAVNFADQALALKHWIHDNQRVIAVGQTTQQALFDKNISAICPQQHTSEGVLLLPELSATNLCQKNVLIVRGDGGRELMAEQLSQRGAKVEYLESYQRIWLNFTQSLSDKWRKENITGIIITSNELLKRVVDLVDISDNYWQNTCLWIVASDRIMQTAQQLGLHNVINTNGANDQAIITTLLTMGSDHDRRQKASNQQ